MVLQSGAAAAEASTLTEAVGNFGKEFGSQFASAAKSNFAQYFKGWKKSWIILPSHERTRPFWCDYGTS